MAWLCRRRGLRPFFGLGFDPLAPVAVFERLEPGNSFAFYAYPGSGLDYAEQALSLNKEFLEEEIPAEQLFSAPLGAVEGMYRILGELCAQHLRDWNVVLVPLGPKTHVLASVLVAHRLRAVSCIRTQTQWVRPKRVEAAGVPCATRVTFGTCNDGPAELCKRQGCIGPPAAE